MPLVLDRQEMHECPQIYIDNPFLPHGRHFSELIVAGTVSIWCMNTKKVKSKKYAN